MASPSTDFKLLANSSFGGQSSTDEQYLFSIGNFLGETTPTERMTMFNALRSREEHLLPHELVFLQELRRTIPAVVRGEAEAIRITAEQGPRPRRVRRALKKKEIEFG